MLGERPQWDRVVDVVVVGTGGGALVSATLASDGGAEVLVVEKDAVVGGTTGVSGGVMWVPQNEHMADAGIDDSRDDALAYIFRLADRRAPDPSLIEVFVDTAPEMLAYLNAKTPLRTQIVTVMPDYYFAHPSDIPGKRGPGRSVEPLPFAVRTAVGEWADRVAARSTLMSLGSQTTLVEDLSGTHVSEEERARREREDLRAKGAAYIGALLKGLLDRGVDIRVDTPARARRGRRGGARDSLRARRRIVHRRSAPRRRARLRWLRVERRNGTSIHRVRGEAAIAREQYGRWSRHGDGGRRQAWEHDVVLGAGRDVRPRVQQGRRGRWPDVNGPRPQLVGRERTGDALFQRGRHLQRLAQGVRELRRQPPRHAQPATRLANLRSRDASGAPDSLRGRRQSDAGLDRVSSECPRPRGPDRARRRSTRGDRIAIQRAGRAGVDDDFGRTHVRTLEPPFFAAATYPATLGTNGGLRINGDGQVLAYRGGIVPGLYAAGNTAAGIFGGAYPSGGAPIAAGATFGYLAGRHAAAQSRRDLGGS